MAARLKVLYLTHHGPLPSSSGGRLRDAALLPRLSERADLDLWAVSRTPDQDRAALAGYPHGGAWRVYPDDGEVRNYPTRESAAAAADLRAHLAGRDPYDVIHIEGHYLFHLVPERYRTCTVVVEHNVESHLLAQRARAGEPGQAGPGRPAGAAADLAAVRDREEAVWRAVPRLITLSGEDRARVRAQAPGARVSVIGNGADHVPRLAPRLGRADADPVVGFLANYRYPPNLDALSWLLGDIFPAIRARVPRSRLLLAGANLSQALAGHAFAGQPLPDRVTAHGWYDDLAEFWNATDVVLCPLRIGGGVKVKMIEALRSGALTVATSVALEGLPASAREAVSLAESTDELAAAAAALLRDESLRREKQAWLLRAQDDLPGWDDVAAAIARSWLTVG
jgi:glycosyltransferase involved in cell wall biosynthesis